jgi:4-alpha-glucanotransferase
LPLGPPGAGDSPYDSRSSFAGNPLMISMTVLASDGLLPRREAGPKTTFNAERVEFRRVERWKFRRLRLAFNEFKSREPSIIHEEFQAFVEANDSWLDDFSLYQALREAHTGVPWYRWPRGLRLRESSALDEARLGLKQEVEFHQFTQFIFDRQWRRLKSFANDREIAIMGDIPIYVALDSADVWANQSQFLLDDEGQPIVQAGVPPDLFTADGQLWGNPVYDWERMEADGFRWWEQRIRRVLDLTDIVRVDHFRGFAAGWRVPADETTARNGEWVPGPGRAFFDVLEKRIGRMPIVVEDLGVITPDVESLRDELGYPGMKVLQFAFGDDSSNPYLPHHAVRNSMMYTGTHDNDTSEGWYESATDRERSFVRKYLGTRGNSIARSMLRAVWGSVSTFACAPVQDLLGLRSESRMNVPGVARGNWAWRVPDLDVLNSRATSLRSLTELYDRDRAALSDWTQRDK